MHIVGVLWLHISACRTNKAKEEHSLWEIEQFQHRKPSKNKKIFQNGHEFIADQ